MITSLAIAIGKPLTCIYPGCHYVWTGRTPCTGEKKCIRCGTVVATSSFVNPSHVTVTGPHMVTGINPEA